MSTWSWPVRGVFRLLLFPALLPPLQPLPGGPHDSKPAAKSPPAAAAPDAGRQERILWDMSVGVPPLLRYNSDFSLSPELAGARVAGSVQAAGGAGNDIRVLIRQKRKILFDSGRRRSVVLSIKLDEPGEYTLTFDNSFSIVSRKTVSARIALVYWGVNKHNNSLEQKTARERYQRASGILRRLYDTLEADERSWGTRQLTGFPEIRLESGGAINAAAEWPRNLIKISPGTFEFAERAGSAEDDILAAILSHELGHLFYRHSGYGSGSGFRGVLDELLGVTALDRVQEKEADLLGFGLACQANFNADGMLLLIRKFAELDGPRAGFMRSHPAGYERLKYLEAEAARCRESSARPPAAAGLDPIAPPSPPR
jgi:hypothetical protein